MSLSLLAACAALAACGGSGSAKRQATVSPTPTPGPATVEVVEQAPEVPYVPTPTVVVAKMLEMAKVTKDDLVYDLGSGDGRIVITAAKQYGARGVGYDLDPKRIKESNENARKEGVTDRVRFVQQDLFEADLSGASVVTLYLLPEVNLRLRPKLLRELKPGARVVSHNYDMGDWEPRETVTMEVEGDNHYVFFWVVPPKK